jgi:hypothetical protein
VISVPSTSAVAPSRSTTATGRAVDITRRQSTDAGRAGFVAGRERTTPDRPLVRSDRAERAVRSAVPANEYTGSGARVGTPESAAEAGGAGRDSRRTGLERGLPTYGRDVPGRAVSPYQPGDRAVPRGVYGTTREASQPDAGAGRPTVDRPSYGMPGAIDRRGPAGAPPSQPVGRPGGSPPPSAAPPSGGRSSGGQAGASRGVAVQRSGGRGGR